MNVIKSVNENDRKSAEGLNPGSYGSYGVTLIDAQSGVKYNHPV